ncbi:MAG: ABC transporter permease [Erysipelotrichales bacterium]|nr:ABC transporter permease [Erysipelotrichales bacterium]MBQ2310096.1 ABC transporter permease [Erysipelotrichales bacterium]MBQ2479481.1 ABC transporter permease [Erysipelotrichales bacterium]MBQ4011154.1 ABC transporter permease [Erysipelotrichales bacterium]
MPVSQAMWGAIGKGILETLYMTLAGTLISYVLGVPLGVILCVTDEKGILPKKGIHDVLGFIVNIIRSVPFLLLLVYVMPFTRFLVGTTIGTTAVIPPLVIASTPFIARMVESSLKEVDPGVIEAAESMGSTPWQIITKVLLPEAKPSLLVGAAIAVTTILGYTAMAGFVGGGGLGGIATNYGYYKFNFKVMTITIVFLIVIVQVLQEVGMRIAVRSNKRNK